MSRTALALQGALVLAVGAGAVARGVVRSSRHEPRTRVARGVAYLIANQNEDGSFGVPLMHGDPGITALAAYALARAPVAFDHALAEGRDHSVARAARWLLARQQRDGSLAEPSGPVTFRTALALLALRSIDPVAHGPAIARAAVWLEAAQRADGGWGATGNAPSDLLTTAFVTAALRASGATPSSMAVRRACAFATSSQRADGSFEDDAAGLAILALSGIASNEARVAAVLPRRGPLLRDAHLRAHAFAVLGLEPESLGAISAAQAPDGSWEGGRDGMESVPVVATAWALDALSTNADSGAEREKAR